MEPAAFASLDATALRWLRTQEAPIAFQLLSGDTLAADLTWKSHGGTLAVARTASATWTLKRVGFLNPRASLRLEGATSDLARVSIHLNYHRIDIVGAPSYRFHRAGVLLPAWQVTSDSGEQILHIEPVRDGRKLIGGAVVTSARGAKLPELPLLLVLSWYTIVLAWFEDEAFVPLEGEGVPRA